MEVKELLGKYRYGMRAMGSIAGTYHTNTLEGYEHWKKKGIEFWETDVAVTSDNKYVMIGHFLDAETMQRLEIKELPPALTYDWYMKQKLFPKSTRGLTPLSIENIIEFAKEEPKSVYMLDMYPFSLNESYIATKHFLKYLDECIGDNKYLYKRIIVEAYNKEMITAIKEYPQIEYIQMSVSKYMENEKVTDINQFIEYAKDNGINVISYEWRYARRNIKHLEALKQCGFIFISRSITNLFETRKKKRYGVNVALLDYYVTNFLDLVQLARLFISRMEKKHG